MEHEPAEQENSQSQHSDESRDSSCLGQTPLLSPGVTNPDPSTPSQGPPIRHNNVSTVMLHGVPIVSLVIDEKERLCLAQISNTLLKDYSYNEIHNRRVALGITCVQCTPVQLEILRRAGAMPVSSRRCGMITKREAERLVKSFLEDNTPPKLPEDFAFSVHHECGWGCRGFFEPSRYNSSRAKCIKCAFCSVYFSPNKFIFHFHRTPESKYHHPDAANFNSWRRHLKLTPQATGADDIVYAWEDVKAMFNGGSRKRILSSVTSSRSSGSSSMDVSKKSKMDPDSTTLAKPSYASQYPSYNMFSPPGKPYPFASVPGHHSFGMNFPHGKDMHADNSNKPLMNSSLWGTQNNLTFPGYDFFWANTLALSRGSGLRNNYYPALTAKPSAMPDPHFMKIMPHGDAGGNRKLPVPSGHMDNTAHKAPHDRFSAFRPVGRSSMTEEEEVQHSHSAINLSTTEEDENEEIDVTDDMEDDKTNFSSDDEHYVREEEEEEEEEEATPRDGRGDRVVEDVPSMQKGYSGEQVETGNEAPETTRQTADTEVAGVDLTVEKSTKEVCDGEMMDPLDNNNVTEKGDGRQGVGSDRPLETAPMDSGISETSDSELESKDLNGLTREELHKQLRKEIETRRAIEREVLLMKETFHEQAKREKSYRDEMAQQLQVVRETLSSELDLERKSRFSLQQKLKEAHDALHNFSCKMLASRQCDECAYKDSPLPR